MRARSSTTLAFLLALTVPAVGTAADPNNELQKAKAERNQRLGAQLDARRKRPPAVAPPAAQARPSQARGTLHGVADGQLLLGVPVKDAELRFYLGRGFRRVSRPEAIADRTILGNRAYVAYDLRPGTDPLRPGSVLVGQEVQLDLVRDPEGRLVVVAVKAP